MRSSRGAASQSNPFLNRRTDALVGREFTLEKPIVDGSGTVRIDDTIWRVAGPDAPAGSRVRVVQADGASLTVAAAESRIARSEAYNAAHERATCVQPPDAAFALRTTTLVRLPLAQRSAKRCSGRNVLPQLPPERREAVAAAVAELDKAGLAQFRQPRLQIVGEASSQAVRSAREVRARPRAAPR